MFMLGFYTSALNTNISECCLFARMPVANQGLLNMYCWSPESCEGAAPSSFGEAHYFCRWKQMYVLSAIPVSQHHDVRL